MSAGAAIGPVVCAGDPGGAHIPSGGGDHCGPGGGAGGDGDQG
ncbi:MAG TPA: hypothetical protein VK507_10680 [Iamia sp.]|nr:hypothetical protein [Iamia sp.]